jgi:hypothetical protein
MMIRPLFYRDNGKWSNGRKIDIHKFCTPLYADGAQWWKVGCMTSRLAKI